MKTEHHGESNLGRQALSKEHMVYIQSIAADINNRFNEEIWKWLINIISSWHLKNPQIA